MDQQYWGIGDKVNTPKFGDVLIGSNRFGQESAELVFGEFPHSRSDNNIYVRFANGQITGFDGFRVITTIEIEEYNYLKSSGLSGDEIRKGGTCKIYFDGLQCWEFFHRGATEACLTAREIVKKLSEHESSWSVRSERVKLKGRKVYYREQPAVVESLITEQGCVILKAVDSQFKNPIYDKDREVDDTVKCDVLDKNIWWFRD